MLKRVSFTCPINDNKNRKQSCQQFENEKKLLGKHINRKQVRRVKGYSFGAGKTRVIAAC